jgi:hypothetical protein
MSQGIGDPVPAAIAGGVHRLRSKEPTSAVAEGLERAGWSVRVVDLAEAADKAAIMERFVDGLALPAWFGRNWDALSDSLRDLGWWTAGWRGRVIVVRGAGRTDMGTAADRETLAEILEEATASWVETTTPLVVLLRR